MLKNLKSFIKFLFLSKNELESHCRNMRYNRYKEHGAAISHLQAHSFIHSFLLTLLKIERKINHQKLVILGDNRQITDKPVIFAPTHIGGSDIEIAFEAIKTPCWLVLGDPREIYHSLAGLMLALNGVIAFDTAHKRDRKIAKEHMITLLNSGGNLLIFPEGAWNISPNQLVMHLYAGAVELAIRNLKEIT